MTDKSVPICKTPTAGASLILPSSPGALIQSLRQQAPLLQATIENMESHHADFWGDQSQQAFKDLAMMALTGKR